MPAFRSFVIAYRGETYDKIITASSAGRAKYQALLDMRDVNPDARITEFSAHVCARIHHPENFRSSIHRHRGLPLVRIGMRVEVGGKPGVIVGSNSSANLDVEFTCGEVLNCHPQWMIRYIDDQGATVYDFSQSHMQKERAHV